MTDPRSPARREFLAGSAGLLGALALGPLAVGPVRRPGGIHFGIQLYTLRDPLQKDLAGTLDALGALGYREVELAGRYGHSAAGFRAALDHAGLEAPSGHVGIPELTDTLDQTLADAKVLGHEYLVLPWLPEEYRTVDGFRRAADLLNKAGERVRAAGLRLGYHNHDFEFRPLESGVGYDLLLSGTDPKLVCFELDLFWIRKGGADALAYFRNHRGRFRLVHIKDMAADGAMVDVGDGAMDWTTLLTAARQGGVERFIAEHDEAADPLAFAGKSLTYLKHLRL